MKQSGFKPKPKKCAGCGLPFRPYNSLEKYCSPRCKGDGGELKVLKRTRINPVSDKRAEESREYSTLRKVFLEGKFCPVTGQPATQIHHKMGRIGYADDAARAKGLTLFLDVRYWLAVSHEGHEKIEREKKWAIEMGYSISRESKA